jgi:transcriptional/translational regulatory protein YebC/TACO1
MSGHSKWANIKHKKGRADALRGQVTTKISREITIAVKNGGADVTGNMRLKLALQKARENNIPKENILKSMLPFGTFLAVGALIAAVAGDVIVDWYVGFYR